MHCIKYLNFQILGSYTYITYSVDMTYSLCDSGFVASSGQHSGIVQLECKVNIKYKLTYVYILKFRNSFKSSLQIFSNFCTF